MSKMRKLLAILLTFAMVLGMSISTMAATADTDGLDNIVGTSDDRGTIKVLGVEEKNLTTVKAYAIAVAEYDANGVFAGYTNPFNITDITAPTKAELDAISVDDLTAITMSYDATENCYYADDQPVGMYLIKVPNTEASSYNVAIASIYYTNAEGTGNVIEQGTVTIGAIASANAWAKKNVVVVLDKSVNGKEGITADVDVNDANNYKITLDPIPSYSGANPVFKVTDVMSASLTYNNDLVVKIVKGSGEEKTLTEGTDYTVAFDSKANTLIINFVVDKEYKLNAYADETVEITYTAALDEDAVLNQTTENKNTATLEYTVDSNVTANENPTSDDTTYVYSFSITGLSKVDQDGKPLDGAEFTLYTSYDEATDTCSNMYTNDLFEGVATSTDGVLTIDGVAAGTYYLRETKAPDGYSLNTHVYTIVVTADIDDTEGTLTDFSVKTDNADEVEIPNTTLAALPSTGGIGTTIFTVAGCGIMIAAAYLFFNSRRREEA